MWVANSNEQRSSYPPELRAILSIEATQESRQWLAHWRGIRAGATPLWELPTLAARLGMRKVYVKDESVRSTLGSFKALGAPIALIRLIQRLRKDAGLSAEALFYGQHRNVLQDLTAITATDGNHGRALAAAARDIGCGCVIVLHAHVSSERERAIAEHGARIVRIDGDYDDSVRHAAELAATNGWHVVSDTSYEGYEDIPRDVMQGYGTIAAEVIEQTNSEPRQPAFTHVFLQGGVGGLAAVIASYLWEFHGPHRPRCIVVEPRQADCLYQSALAGKPARATGSIDSVMAGLACGEVSPLAWKILRAVIDGFILVEDDAAVEAMRMLAAGAECDIPIVAGESGAAGLAGLIALSKDSQLANAAGLNEDSRVLLINTEGATAPSVYRELVGETWQTVLERQTIATAAAHRTPPNN